MDQSKKPTTAERNEKVRQVLLASSEPLGPGEIAAKIGEEWCNWNGFGRGSAVMPALTQIGAKRSKGKWSLGAPRVQLDHSIQFQTVSMPSADAALLESLQVEVLVLDSLGVTDITLDDLCDAFAVPRPISFEPGHLMSWEKYRELEKAQQ